MRAVVVFSGRGLPFWRLLLEPGFLHCELWLEMWPSRWVGVAGGAGGVQLHPTPTNFDPVMFAKRRGLTWATAETRTMRGYKLFARCDCVGIAKQVLGIKAWRLWTPLQLYNHLTAE